MSMNKIGTRIHKAFNAADDAWSEELQRCFGKEAGDKRYVEEGKGASGSLLRLTHDARDTLRRAWELEGKVS